MINGQIEIHDISKPKSNGHIMDAEDNNKISSGLNGEINEAYVNSESDLPDMNQVHCVTEDDANKHCNNNADSRKEK